MFRARDTKLNRDVALKVLPDSFESDAERLARLAREAQTLASLNIPTSRRSTVLKNPAVCGPSSWNWSRARTFPSGLRADRYPGRSAVDREADCRGLEAAHETA